MRPIILFTLLTFFVIPNILSAQTINLDSLRTIINLHPSDTTKLRAAFDVIQSIKTNHLQESGVLAKDFYKEAVEQDEDVWIGKAATDLGTYYFYSNQLDSTILYFKKAFQAHERANVPEGMAVALGNMGSVYIEKSQFDTARDYLYKALNINLSRKDSFKMSQNYSTIGLAFDYEADYDSAMIHYYNALEIAEDINNKSLISQQLNNIGNIQLFREDFEKAMTNFRKSLAIDIKLNNQRSISSAYNNIGMIYDDLNQNDSALVYYFKALTIDSLLGTPLRIANRYNNIGYIYLEEKEYQRAENYFLESLEIKEKAGYPERIASTSINLGQLYVLMKKPVLAEKYLRQALDIALEYGHVNWQKEVYEGFSQLNEQKGNYKEALVYYKQYKVTYDSIFNEEKNLTIKNLEIKYEKEVDQRKIAQQAFELEKGKQQRIWFIMGLIILGLSSFILFLLFLRNRQQKRDIEKDLQALKKTNTELLQNLDKMEQHQKTPAYLADQLFTLETGGIQEIKLGDIIYIEASKNNTFFYTINGQHLERKHLKAVMEILPSELFLQVKRFYTINVLQIKKRTKRDITLTNGETIRIGATFRESVDSFFDENKNKD